VLLFALAIVIGTIVELILAIASGSAGYVLSSIGDEYGPLLVNILINGAPFLFLAAQGITARTPWAVGLILAALVWGYVAIEFMRGGFERGTSVGNSMWLAAISIGSNLVITIICWTVSRRRPVGS
jgi:hypothetical protein